VRPSGPEHLDSSESARAKDNEQEVGSLELETEEDVLLGADAGGAARLVVEGLLAAQGPGPQGGSMWTTVIFIGAMVAIFYVMLIRPQQKQAKEHQTMLAALKKGDVVVTNGGIVGKVHQVTDKFLVIEAARDVRLRVLRSAVSGKAPDGLLDEGEQKAESKPEKDKEK